jgi:RND family efflux transporter MFP subunit
MIFDKFQRKHCAGRRLGHWIGLMLICCLAATPASSPAGAEAVEFDCVIEPQQVVKLASAVVGVISSLEVDRGDSVRQGQVVGRLEDSVEAAALALARARSSNESPIRSAEARLRFLQSEHERLVELQGKDVVSRAKLQSAEEEANVAAHQLQEAKLNKDIAELQVRYAEEILAQRILRSPIDGVVMERLLVPGEYQNEQSPILTLAQIDPLRVEAFVPTTYYGQIRTGSTAEVRPEQPIGGAFMASVVVVDQVLDAASGTFGVRLALPNSELRLPAGIRCKVLFDVSQRPATSVLAGDGKQP